MDLTSFIYDGLKNGKNTKISFDFVPIPTKSIGSMVPLQMPEEMVTKTTPVIRQQIETGEDIEVTQPTERLDGSVSTQAKTTQEGQTPNSSIPQLRDQSLEIKAATGWLNTENSYHAAVEKYQENTLKYQDNLQIQNIQNSLYLRQPADLTGNVDVKVNPPLDAFPEIWLALMNSISCFLNVPVSTLFSALLAAVYTAVCGKFKIEVRKDYFETCTEYFIAVMPSGFNKSGIVKTFRNPHDKYIENLQTEFDKQANNQKITMKLFKQFEKKLLKKFADQAEGKDGAEIDLMLKDIEMQLEPLRKKLSKITSRPNLFSDFPTPKKLGENMKAQNEVGAILEAEGGLLKCRVRANDDMLFLKAYTDEPFGNETATNGSVILQSPCLTICSYIQPGVAAELYSKEDLKDDGFLPRILPFFCLSKPTIHNSIYQGINLELMSMYKNKIKSILDYCWEESREGISREIEILQMTAAAQQEYSNFFHKVNSQTHEGRFEHCKAFASKLAGHAVRLAGAVHFLEHDKPWEKPIGSSAMRAGIALAEFYAEHAIFAFDKKQNDAFVYAKKIIDWIKNRHVTDFNPRVAQQGIAHGCKINQIEEGIYLLVKHNYLASYQNYKGKMIYIVNPNIFTFVGREEW